jgi:hypothetical protein
MLPQFRGAKPVGQFDLRHHVPADGARRRCGSEGVVHQVHWSNPQQFDPDRYKTVPTSDQIDEAKCKQIGFARCPFDITKLDVVDGRKASLTNSGFGTVFGVVDGKPLPVADYAGYAPFGFGYRRCPGEQLTVQVFEDFLRKVWKDKIEFVRLNLPTPGQVPVGPGAVIEDDIGFTRRS